MMRQEIDRGWIRKTRERFGKRERDSENEREIQRDSENEREIQRDSENERENACDKDF
jgi:hypothetical protein